LGEGEAVNILIADDEPLARQRLRYLLADLQGDYVVVAEVADGEAVLRCCASQVVDLVLLDIRMPKLSGLAVASQLAQRNTPPAVVFVTAYNEHAVAAFERQAMDYLVKPVRLRRLQQALERARVLTRPQLEAVRLASGAADRAARVCGSYRGGVECVELAQVIYFRAEQKYVEARHAGGVLLLEASLKSLEDAYGDDFLRIHRNALIARDRLTGIGKQDGLTVARLRGCDEVLEISRRHLAQVRAWLTA
jgi:two-component system response regulator AlgR